MRYSLAIIALFIILASGCSLQQQENQTLHIIHAGSLGYPVKELSEAFKAEHPDVNILTEAWGSKAGARRVMEIESPADVFLSADYMVIENMLIPEHASWYMPFASNEMAIVFTNNSRYADEINQANWHDILLRQDVSIGRSDPDHDPCGVRAVFTSKLAGLFYKNPAITDSLLAKDIHNIRPKETDLIALLENGHLDYIFLYRSVAQQHKLQYLRLPAELSLGDPSFTDWYSQVHTTTLGGKPGEKITETGQPMIYGATIPHKTQNPELAQAFVAFLMSSKGMQIMESLGQPPVEMAPNPYYDKLPEILREFASAPN